MNKKIIYKGYELLEAMQKGIYQDGTKFILDKISKQYIFFTKIATGEGEHLKLYRKDGNKIFEVRIIDTEDLLNNNFVLVEENTEEIEELIVSDEGFIKTKNGCWKGRKLDVAFANEINELVKAVSEIRKDLNNNK